MESIKRLTGRETEVVRLLVEGKTNKEIAFQLSISEHTVRAHMRSIVRLTGLPNRTAIAVWYIHSTQGAQLQLSL